MELEKLRFLSQVVSVAEDELEVAFSEDADSRLMLSLYDDYISTGRPKKVKAWIREKLNSLFVCVAERPVWVEDYPYWPFEDGVPMTFIKQLTVEANAVSLEKLAHGEELYVFGCRKYDENQRFRMFYRVISQDKDFKGLVIEVREENGEETYNLKTASEEL